MHELNYIAKRSGMEPKVKYVLVKK